MLAVDVDRGEDLALGDVVARADLGLVGQRRDTGRRTAAARRREDQLLGVLGERDAEVGVGGDHRPQHAVRRRVADEDAAEQAGAVLADDELLVQPGHGVGVHELQCAVGGAERVAEGRDVDAEQLELGAHVGALEGAGAAEERVDHDLGHVVARGHQAVHPTTGRGALADRPDVRRRGAALLVDEHAAALRDVEAGVAGELVAGADSGGEDDDLGDDGVGVLERERADPTVVTGGDLLGHHAGVHLHAELLDVAHQRGATGVVELHRHQPRSHLDDVGLQAQLHQRVGGLEAEQPAADDDARGRAGHDWSSR